MSSGDNIEELMRKWGYGDEIIEKFKYEGIRESHLLKLTEFTLEKFFPKAGERLDFMEHVRNYEIDLINTVNCQNHNEIEDSKAGNFHPGASQHACSQMLFVDSVVQSQPFVSDTPVEIKVDPLFLEHNSLLPESHLAIKRPRLTNILETLLHSTPEGKVVIANYMNEGKLNDYSRQKIGDEIIREELKDDIHKNFPNEKVDFWASKIIEMFPGEKYEHWAGATNGKLRNTSAGRGILLARYYGMRRKLIKAGVIKKSSTTESQSSVSNVVKSEDNKLQVQDTLLKTVEIEIQWIKENCQSVESVMDKWKFSSIARIKHLRESNQSVHEYMEDFKVLKMSDGYVLLETDFKCHYPESALKLYTEWTTLSSFILHNAKLSDKNVVNNCLTSDGKKASTIRLLNSMFNVRTFFGKTKKQWRPSRTETMNGLLQFLKSEDDILPTLNGKRKKLTDLGIPHAPQAILISPDEDTIEKCFVVVDQTCYLVENPLKALDVAFKAAHMLNTSYPKECCREMFFLQLAVYEFTTSEVVRLADQKIPTLVEEYRQFKSKLSRT